MRLGDGDSQNRGPHVQAGKERQRAGAVVHTDRDVLDGRLIKGPDL